MSEVDAERLVTVYDIDAADPFEDIAWKYTFEEGEVLISWGARQAYGLDPVRNVHTPSLVEESIPEIQEEGLPSVRIAVVAPDEIEGAAKSLMLDQDEFDKEFVLPTEYFCTLEEDRINILMACETVQTDDQETLKEYFYPAFRGNWSYWSRKLEEPRGFGFVATHLFTDLARAISRTAIVEVMGSDALAVKDDPSGETVAHLYGEAIAENVHRLFCADDHDDLPAVA